MMELNNLLKSLDIDKDYHDKIFDNMILENLYTKVDLNKYATIKNRIYWMSLLIYMHMTEKWCACSAPSVYL